VHRPPDARLPHRRLERHRRGAGAPLRGTGSHPRSCGAAPGQKLVALAAELPGSHACYPLDVADAAALQAAAADFIARHGCPDIVIANAGISAGTLGEDAGDLPALRRILDTNLIGMAQTLQPFIAAMKARGSGRLAGIASVAGIRGLPGAGAYSASKAATIAWLEALRVELRGSGVRVVTIAPGYIATPMTAVNRYPMPFLMPADEARRRISPAPSSAAPATP
jgi:NAD(P)-dependent dehydrogenase (short-subunit alcohol dehydrogenase family)